MWLAFGVALSALTLYLAVSQFAWNELTGAVSSAHLEWLAAALAIQILSTLLKAARWQVLLGVPQLSFRGKSQSPQVTDPRSLGSQKSRIPEVSDPRSLGSQKRSGRDEAEGTKKMRREIPNPEADFSSPPTSLEMAPAAGAPRLFPLFAALVIGQTFNLLVPLRLGEIARAWLVKRRYDLRGAFALSTIGVEKLGDAIILFVLFISTLPFLVPPAWFQATLLSLAVTTLIAFVILLLLRYRKATLSDWVERTSSLFPRVASFLTPRVKPIFDGADALNSSGAQILFWALGLAAWLCAALTNYFAFRAFDLQLGMSAALFLLVVLQAGIALPSLPGKIGVFNYACVLALRVFAVNDAQAFAFSLGLYAVVIVVTVLLGGALLLFNPLALGSIADNLKDTKTPS